LRVFLLGIGLFAGPARGQEGGGVLTGTVTDRSNAVVPGVTISITHTGTGLTRTSITDTSGGYAIRALPVGTYDVTATGSGFATLRSTGAEVSVGSTTRLDVQLQVATVTQDVTVHAEAAILNTESGAGGVLLNSSHVTNLPLNGRNFLQLVALEPGVRQNSTTGRQSFVFNGAPPGQGVNLLVDGTQTRPALKPRKSAVSLARLASPRLRSVWIRFPNSLCTPIITRCSTAKAWAGLSRS
jgi:hypothetical protein